MSLRRFRAALFAAAALLAPSVGLAQQTNDVGGVRIGLRFNASTMSAIELAVPRAWRLLERSFLTQGVTDQRGLKIRAYGSGRDSEPSLIVITDLDERIVGIIRDVQPGQPLSMADAMRDAATRYGPASVFEVHGDGRSHLVHRTPSGALAIGEPAATEARACVGHFEEIMDALDGPSHHLRRLPISSRCGVIFLVRASGTGGQPQAQVESVMQIAFDLAQIRRVANP